MDYSQSSQVRNGDESSVSYAAAVSYIIQKNIKNDKQKLIISKINYLLYKYFKSY